MVVEFWMRNQIRIRFGRTNIEWLQHALSSKQKITCKYSVYGGINTVNS